MIRTATILLLVLITSSCENKKVVKTLKFPSYEEDTLALIRDIARDITVDTSPIGFTGELTKTGQFIRYEILKRVASDQFLLQLTDHQSPAVRTYAFFILNNRNSSLMPKVLEKLKNDNSFILWRTGCSSISVSINSLLFLADQKNLSSEPAKLEK